MLKVAEGRRFNKDAQQEDKINICAFVRMV